jgi:hypothetical protein
MSKKNIETHPDSILLMELRPYNASEPYSKYGNVAKNLKGVFMIEMLEDCVFQEILAPSCRNSEFYPLVTIPKFTQLFLDATDVIITSGTCIIYYDGDAVRN